MAANLVMGGMPLAAAAPPGGAIAAESLVIGPQLELDAKVGEMYSGSSLQQKEVRALAGRRAPVMHRGLCAPR